MTLLVLVGVVIGIFIGTALAKNRDDVTQEIEVDDSTQEVEVDDVT